jgi:lipopolysaccharide biosynthesis regulator YciM
MCYYTLCKKQVLRAIQPGESDAPEEGQVTQQQYYTVFMSEDEWRKAYDIAEVYFYLYFVTLFLLCTYFSCEV